MNKKKFKLTKILFIGFIITIITLSILILVMLDKTKIDMSLIKTGSSSITRVFYFDYFDREKRIGEPKEIESESLFLQKSEWKSLYEMNQNLPNAFIAIEDKRFYEHNGVDWLRTVKAIFNYLFKFDKKEYGGSTITQQLIKNLTGENDYSAKRKIEEIFRAINLEKDLSKNEILETYLNVVYLSQNCYGVGTASEAYFNKSVEDLTLSECASLASIVQNPSKYDPYKNPQNNMRRRNLVLKVMLEQELISQEEYNLAISEKLNLNPNIEDVTKSGIYSWYTEALIDDVSSDLANKYNLSKEAAKKIIFKGGLNLYSLMDVNIQTELEEIYKNYVAQVDNQGGSYPQSSCVVIDPKTSDVIALVGGIGEKNGNLVFNRATNAKRPPGSVIKPLSVYAIGIEEGIFNYSSIYDDTPIKLNSGIFWPKNSPNRYRGLVPIYYAVEHSINTVAVKALRDIGNDKSIKYLNEFGIAVDNHFDKNESSLALGQLTNGESLLNLTNAYCTFANGGIINKPKTYLYVTDNSGNIILSNQEQGKRVISKETSYIMNRILKNVVDFGTASFMNINNNVEVIGKTGTSSNNEDKWFIGCTPNYVCGVWTGYDQPKPMYYSKNPSCVIFNALMNRIYRDTEEYVTFDKPDTVILQEFCFDSGMATTNACEIDLRENRTKMGYYHIGTQPNTFCELHKIVDIDLEDGLIAKSFTPFWRRRRVSLLNYSREKHEGYNVDDNSFLLDSRKRH